MRSRDNRPLAAARERRALFLEYLPGASGDFEAFNRLPLLRPNSAEKPPAFPEQSWRHMRPSLWRPLIMDRRGERPALEKEARNPAAKKP